MEKLYVLPQYQRKGIGKKLLEKALNYARVYSVGLPIVELNVNRNNPAVNFYEKHGIAGMNTYGGTFSKHDGARLTAEVLFYRAQVEFYMMRSHASAKDNLGIIIYHSLDQMTTANKNTTRSKYWGIIWRCGGAQN